MSDNPIILMIDTSMIGCGVAVYDGERDLVFEAYSDDERGQAQVLVPMTQNVLSGADLQFEDLSDIVVCVGPGTFTGIRIGLSSAKTFGLVLDIPIWGVTSLQALALSAADKSADREMLAIVETKRQDFYVQRFDSNAASLNNAESLMADQIDVDHASLIGNAVQRFDPEKIYDDLGVQRIDVGFVVRYFSNNSALFTQDVSPIYLRAPDVSQPKKPFRTIANK